MMRLAASLAFGAGLTAADVALAQTGSADPAAGSAQPAAAQPAPAQSTPAPQATPPWAQSGPPAIKPADPKRTQPTYSVNPPPDGSSGVYLPAAVLGYGKSVAGCVVVGCEDGPKVNGASGSSSAATAAPPANPGSSEPH
jgi:hypothetical protein